MRYRCPECGKVFADRMSFHRHMHMDDMRRRAAAVADARTSGDTGSLRMHSQSSVAAVRAAAAANPATPHDALELLAGDPNENVRRAVAGNASASDGVRSCAALG